jgi:hypothetical protein
VYLRRDEISGTAQGELYSAGLRREARWKEIRKRTKTKKERERERELGDFSVQHLTTLSRTLRLLVSDHTAINELEGK